MGLPMNVYRSKFPKLPGTNYKEVYKHAQAVFKIIKHRTKRKPYIRSLYFHKQKVFFDFFWVHISQKREADRTRRLKYFESAIDLIEKTRIKPDTMQNPNKKIETLYRFAGLTKEKELFYVQIKENKRTRSKQLMSIFPGK